MTDPDAVGRPCPPGQGDRTTAAPAATAAGDATTAWPATPAAPSPRRCAGRGPRTRAAARGFTLVELMVTITLLALLLGLAMPNFRLWLRNAQVRTVTDALQTGLRLAQAEALRRNRQTVFFLTTASACNPTIGAAAGPYWSIRTVPLFGGDTVDVVQCGMLADTAAGVTITGPAVSICFNSMGRLTANPSPGVTGASCSIGINGSAGATTAFDVSATGADRPLRVTVSLGGQTRMCDPARVIGATTPDGCPP